MRGVGHTVVGCTHQNANANFSLAAGMRASRLAMNTAVAIWWRATAAHGEGHIVRGAPNGTAGLAVGSVTHHGRMFGFVWLPVPQRLHGLGGREAQAQHRTAATTGPEHAEAACWRLGLRGAFNRREITGRGKAGVNNHANTG